MIEANNISFYYNKTPCLQNISFILKPGKIYALLGPNGSGKSTLLKLCAGILKPQKGAVHIYGAPLSALKQKQIARQVSILLQEHPRTAMTVKQIVLSGRYPYKSFYRHFTPEDKKIAEKAMALTHCHTLQDKEFTRLSGGEKQRVLLAMALAQDTDIILLDEPTTFLDMNIGFEIMALLSHLHQKQGKTFLFVSHDLSMALRYAHEIIILDKGHIIAHDTPENIIQTGILSDTFHIGAHQCIKNNVHQYCFYPRPLGS